MNKQIFAKLNRESTKITIAEFYERTQLKKYNFNPKYQRRGDVWDEEKQSFLIDTILKNYPMPPIFLHQEINEQTGATLYNIIDGKQRLSAILKFINNEIELPEDYDVGAFGDSRLNGKKFNDLEGELGDFKMQFWRYVLTIEYIENSNLEIINNVFDRLNRNGEPLEPQELRKSRYHSTNLMKMVECLSTSVDWTLLGKVKINRMQDLEFVSEMVFLLLEQEPIDASQKSNIDEYYEKWAPALDEKRSIEVKEQFKKCIMFISEYAPDFNKFKINGVSHFYALFGFAYKCSTSNIKPNNVSEKLIMFYTALRSGEKLSGDVLAYKESMQSNTRSKSQRVRRISALSNFCNLEN